MSDLEHSAHNEAAGSLAQQIDGILAPLGGRYAVAAQRFGQQQQPKDENRIALHADEIFPAASLAKLSIAVELLRRADLGQFALDERFDTADEPRVGGGGVLDYLDPTTQLTLNDLCFLMLGVSDNTAANFLLDLVGMGEVNETMSRLKLSQTKLARHFMDFAARAAHRDNLTSASDMLSLLTLLRGGALPGAGRIRELLAAQQLDGDLRAWLPETAQLSHKSGALDDTGAGDGVFHDAGFLSGPSGGCVYCILTAGWRDQPAARYAVGRTLRALWDRWCA